MKKNKTRMIFMLVLSLVLALVAPADGVAKAKRPSLNKKKLTLKVGKTSKLRLKNNRKKVKWSTANKKIATVSKKGVVRGRKDGKTRITAKAGGKKYTCRVSVIKRTKTTKPNPSPSDQPTKEQGYASEVLRLVNVERAKYGLSPLVLDQKLCSAADLRAKEIAQVFSHTRPDGRRCFSVLDEFGIHYRMAAENIARGQTSAESVVTGWMNSSGHRANILEPDFKALGVGHTEASFPCWVQLFTDRVSDSSENTEGGSSGAPTDEPTSGTVPTDESTSGIVPADEPTSGTVSTDEPAPSIVSTNEPEPSIVPTDEPISGTVPTGEPEPSIVPTDEPVSSIMPTDEPKPSIVPTDEPAPSTVPTDEPEPSIVPTDEPAPSAVPSDDPGTSDTPGTGQITTPPPVDTSAYPNEVLRLVNAERAKVGAQPLVLDTLLCEAATVRAQELITQFSHTRPDGTNCFSVLKDMGIRYMACGENIAAGYATPEAVVSGWMDSEGHRENILDASYGKLGVGFVKTDTGYRYYWVQLFTN